MKKKYILTVTLNPALDCFVLRGKKEIYSAGGKGINVSRGLKRLGVETVATGFWGGKIGLRIKKYLHQERINHDFVETSAETRINLTMAGDFGRHQRVIEEGHKVQKKFIDLFFKKYRQLLKKSRGVVICGRNANGLSDKIYSDLIQTARWKNIPVFLDTSSAALKRAIKAKPFLIKVNEEEMK